MTRPLTIFKDVRYSDFFQTTIKSCFEGNQIKVGRNGIWFKIRKVKIRKGSILISLPKKTGFADKIELPLPDGSFSQKNFYRFINKGKKIGEYQSEEIFFKNPLLT